MRLARRTQHNAGVNIVTSCRRLEPHHRLGRLAGANRPDVVPHAAVAAGVARRANLVKQPLRRQPGELLEARIDDPREGIQLVGHRRPRRVARATRRQVPVQLPRHDPLVDRPATHPEAPRQLGLRDAPVQVVASATSSSPIRASGPRSFPVDDVNSLERGAEPSNHQGVQFSVATNGKFTVAANNVERVGRRRAPRRRPGVGGVVDPRPAVDSLGPRSPARGRVPSLGTQPGRGRPELAVRASRRRTLPLLPPARDLPTAVPRAPRAESNGQRRLAL